MKKLHLVPLIMVVFVLQFNLLPVRAATTSETQVTGDGTNAVTADYLISAYSLGLSNSNNQLCLNGRTHATITMKSIGFKSIVVERSSNGTSGWSPECNLSDILNSNATSCLINNMSITVTHGYYYRVSCVHYAKSTALIPKTQSISNTSNTVYIP